MAANALERAVLEAARLWRHNRASETALERMTALMAAVEAYEAWLADQEPTVGERGWHEVVAGDEVQSIKNKRWYGVRSVLKLPKGKYRLELAGVPAPIVRPSDAEPTAMVRRGPDGSAVDTILHVFSSREK